MAPRSKSPKTKKGKSLNAKFCSCKIKVSKKSPNINAYAVCTAAVYGSRGMKRPAGAMKYCDKPVKSQKSTQTKILNPKTGRMVIRDGKVGRDVLKSRR